MESLPELSDNMLLARSSSLRSTERRDGGGLWGSSEGWERSTSLHPSLSGCLSCCHTASRLCASSLCSVKIIFQGIYIGFNHKLWLRFFFRCSLLGSGPRCHGNQTENTTAVPFSYYKPIYCRGGCSLSPAHYISVWSGLEGKATPRLCWSVCLGVEALVLLFNRQPSLSSSEFTLSRGGSAGREMAHNLQSRHLSVQWERKLRWQISINRRSSVVWWRQHETKEGVEQNIWRDVWNVATHFYKTAY